MQNNIKVTHCTESISSRGGGISVALRGLTEGLNSSGLTEQGLISFSENEQSFGSWDACDVKLIERSSALREWWRFSHRELPLCKGDLYHTHGLWTRFSVMVPRQNKPWMVSPHGMLDSWALARSAWKKRIARLVFENRHLQGASCLHALCDSELTSIRRLGFGNPICVIPNGVDLPAEDNTNHKPGEGKKTLLFLGRIHPKKGLINALKAWSKSGMLGGWQLVVAGWDQGGHAAELKRLCNELALQYSEKTVVEFLQQEPNSKDSVVFLGSAFGEEKEALLRRASAFILPSFSEGLPMSVLEAWSYGLPVLMTDQCNLPEGFAAGAAIRLELSAHGVLEGLRELDEMSDQEIVSMGSKGRSLVKDRFTWARVAAEMASVYGWILGGGERPACVKI